MERLGLQELKDVELDILRWIKSICEKNNLRYYLAYGTLIGAVRHKGFIPWDDDIDIHMPREDYDRFVEICSRCQDERYKVLSCDTVPDYYYEFAKVSDTHTLLIENNIRPIKDYGVYVDIFPLDYLPDNSSFLSYYLRGLQRLRVLLIYDKLIKYNRVVRFLCKIAKLMLNFINPVQLAQYANKVARRSLHKTHKFLFVPGLKKTLPISVISDSVKLQFEGDLFDAPVGWDEYLTLIYGNYMMLPPVEKQVTHHNFEAYYIKK